MLLTHFQLSSLIPVMVLIGIASIITLILAFLPMKTMPIFIVELIIGIILGLHPAVYSFFMTPINQGIFVISMAMLLFISGFDTDFSVFNVKEGEFPVFKWVIRATLCVFCLSFLASFIFGKYIIKDYLIGIILITIFFASTFESYVAPILHAEEELPANIVKLSSSYATLAEFLSIVLLSIMMIIVGDFQYWWIVLIILAGLFLVRLTLHFVPKKPFLKAEGGFSQLGLRLSLFIFLVFIILSEKAGIEIIFGAFAFGMVVKHAKVPHRIVDKIQSFGAGFFTPLFFILLGIQVPLIQVFSHLDTFLLTALILAIMLVVKLPILYLNKWYSRSTSVIAYLLSTSTLIVALAIDHFGILNQDLTNSLIVASAISCIIPVIVFYLSKTFGQPKEPKDSNPNHLINEA